MKFAVIDLGTNTFNILIAEKLNNATFKKVFNTKISVKLGENSINEGYISNIPFQRGISALQQFKKYIIDYNVEYVYAFATSAIRSAKNGNDFVNEAKEKTDIVITVIDGNEEAELIYYGNRMAVKMSNSISLIMDIGGGSTEFILANSDGIFWKKSFLLGTSRLLEKFKPSDPITLNEITAFNSYLKLELLPLFDAVKQYKPTELIGSSGAFDSIVDMISGEYNELGIVESKTEYNVDLIKYNFISQKIIKSTLKERAQIKGLIEMRVDMMVISILLVDFILTELNLHKLIASTFSLKEGVIAKKIGLSNS
jgi:exopolyphosphatase/guanosine-5'-triphosphate,3'-diphosphate pyrophosphatase